MTEAIKALLQTDIGAWISVAALFVTAASAAANLTKTDADDKVVGIVGKVINWAALNIKVGPKG